MKKSVNLMRCKVVKERSIKYDALEHEVDCPDDAVSILRALGLSDASDEYFYEICLSCIGQITGVHEISHGELSATMVHPREVLKRALVNNASGIIVAHNHPSGNPEPSSEDIETTKRIKEACRILGITLMDHIIIAGNDFTSFKTDGLL